MKTLILLLATSLTYQITVAQNKKIINDLASLQFELVTVKTQTEEIGKDIKRNWIISKPTVSSVSSMSTAEGTQSKQPQVDRPRVSDSLITASKINYNEVKGTVNGLIAQFQVVIKKPRLMNAQFKRDIQTRVSSLHEKLKKFESHYVNGTMLLVSGSAMAPIPVEAVVPALEAGVKLYKEISKIVAEEREKVASELEKKSGLVDWESL